MPVIDLRTPFRRRLSRRLVRAARESAEIGDSDDMLIGDLVEILGDRSFGWCILVFALVNFLPMPFGSDMVTSIPLLLLTGQMALGMSRVRLPKFVLRIRVGRRRFQRLVLWLGPAMRPIERLVRPRYGHIFLPRSERALGCFLFLVSVALFAPIPFSGYVPAASLSLAAIGLIERDGLLALAGVVLGVVAIVLTVLMGTMLFLGADALVH